MSELTKSQKAEAVHEIFKDLPGYPWLDPCPRCGYRGSCDCTVLERARTALPGLQLPDATVHALARALAHHPKAPSK